MTDLATLAGEDLSGLGNDDLARLAAEYLQAKSEIRKENQILYYEPTSARAWGLWETDARVVGLAGGNGSGKTENCLVLIAAMATGVFPNSVSDHARRKFRGPVHCRVVVESLTTTLQQVILRKLQWWQWTGEGEQGGERGHWGWVPKTSLKGGDWEKSWSEKYRTLTLICRDPDDPDRILGESIIQFMSHDMDASDFASGDYHWILHDEPPKLAIWTEDEARTMRVSGVMLLAMTWPDDPSIPVDWIFDKLYDRRKSPDVEWIELSTMDNRHLDQKSVARQMAAWSEAERQVRIFGQPIRFSNLIHPLFTDTEKWWCFPCGKVCFPIDGVCGCERRSVDITSYIHVRDFEIGDNWPCAFLLDPHPRKPHALLWVAIDPSDDLWVVAEDQIEGDATDVRIRVDEKEETMGLDVRLRLMDPNMGRSPSSAKREITWEDEFDAAGLRMDLADDSSVGRKRINQYLKPDPSTHRPRLTVHERCLVTIQQMNRHVWDDYRRTTDRDLKQQPKDKNSDFPALLKYLANFDPLFLFLYAGAPVLERPGERRGAY